jgi:hypothetical protein
MNSGRHRSQDSVDRHPPLVCWYCDRPSTLGAVLGNGIIVSRTPAEGGPYRVFLCPYCLKESMVEESTQGRWFSSPNVKLGILDYLFTRNARDDDHDSHLILKAISWFRDNEDRRRSFFETDGDCRYSGTSFLKVLWPWGREEQPTRSEESRRRARQEQRRAEQQVHEARSKRSAAEEARRREQARRAEERRRQQAEAERSRPRILTPYAILGIAEGASREEIKKRFHSLAVQYHPDKVHHLGVEFQEHAHEKFVALQEAYRDLMARRDE